MQSPLVEAPMGRGQIRICVGCFRPYAIDGFGMQEIVVAGRGIAAE